MNPWLYQKGSAISVMYQVCTSSVVKINKMNLRVTKQVTRPRTASFTNRLRMLSLLLDTNLQLFSTKQASPAKLDLVGI